VYHESGGIVLDLVWKNWQTILFDSEIQEDAAMSGPGEYLPDPTEKITNSDDLPKPTVKTRSRIRKKVPVFFVNAPPETRHPTTVPPSRR